jgi:hypothetical protein
MPSPARAATVKFYGDRHPEDVPSDEIARRAAESARQAGRKGEA